MRAFRPAPGALRALEGEPLKIWRARVATGSGGRATVLRCRRRAGRRLRRGARSRYRELQRAGGRRLTRKRVPARPPPAARRAVRVRRRSQTRCAMPRAMVARVAAGASLAERVRARRRGRQRTPRAALIDLTHGTLRRYGRVQAIVRQLSRRARGRRARGGIALVRALRARVRPLCRIHGGRSGGARLRAAREMERQGLRQRAAARLPARARRARGAHRRPIRKRATSIRAWWIERCARAYPARWESMLAAGNIASADEPAREPRGASSVAEYQARLRRRASPRAALGDEALLLERPVPVERLPGIRRR